MKRLLRCALAGALLCGCQGDQARVDDEASLGDARQPFLAYYEVAGVHFYLPGATTHADITEDGLWFLEEDIAEELGEYNEDTDTGDTQDDSLYHADNCRFEETFDSVRRRYDRVVDHVGSGAYEEALKVFGTILHTTQDFYSHSNWVEAGQPEGLTAHHPFEFPSVRPGDPLGSPFGSMVVLQQGMPSWSVARAAHERVPSVATTWGNVAGLITGTYDNEDGPSACVPRGSIPHGNPVVLVGSPTPNQGTYLTKDLPDLPHRDAALDRAQAQTTEEFCRLGRLVLLRRGKQAHNRMISEWVDDRADYERVCGDPLHQVASLASSYLW